MEFEVALILTVKADSYVEALRHADDVAAGLGDDGENVVALLDYEHDNDGQRVVYLSSEDGLEDE